MKPNELLPTQSSPVRLFIITITAIFMAEVFAMIVVYLLMPMPYQITVLVDATIMTVLIFPVLYFLSTRPLLRHIQQRAQTENILQTRLRLIEYTDGHTLDELLKFTLDQIELLTDSTIGYFHFLDQNEKTVWLQAWSTNTLQNMYTLAGEESHYEVDKSGVWADCIRERRPIIQNDHPSIPHRKGLPGGHAPAIREIAVPILREGRIIAILGVGNKPHDYTADDLAIVSTLADFAWEQVRRKQAAEELLSSEEKFRTLVDWTYDWEFWVDPQGSLMYTSPSCQRITGYSREDFIGDPHLMLSIVHLEDRPRIAKHQQSTHSEGAEVEKLEYRIVTRQGDERWIEHICRPLLGPKNEFRGRRVSNRDITERKLAEKLISERNQKEKLLTQTIHTIQLDIARDLHDTLGQNISFLRMQLDHLSERKIRKPAQMQHELERMAEAANESYDLMRGTLAVLQAENSTDLFRLFTRYAEQIQDRSAVKFTCSSDGEPRFMSARRIRQVFYIFREILNNVEKHASASEVSMEMTWNQDCLRLAVFDNGAGFDQDKVEYSGHYGLRFMRERTELLNGLLSIRSAKGSGTSITLEVPYE